MSARIGLTVAALALILGADGCKSAAARANEAALDQAKVQALSTGIAQQVVYTDTDGETVTKLVQPPAPGESVEKITTTKAPGPGPAEPVVTPAPAR